MPLMQRIGHMLAVADNALVSAENAKFSALDTTQTNPEPFRYDHPLAPGISDLYAMGANTVYPQGEYSKLMK